MALGHGAVVVRYSMHGNSLYLLPSDMSSQFNPNCVIALLLVFHGLSSQHWGRPALAKLQYNANGWLGPLCPPSVPRSVLRTDAGPGLYCAHSWAMAGPPGPDSRQWMTMYPGRSNCAYQ